MRKARTRFFGRAGKGSEEAVSILKKRALSITMRRRSAGSALNVPGPSNASMKMRIAASSCPAANALPAGSCTVVMNFS